MNFINYKLEKIQGTPIIYKYFCFFYPLSLIFSRYETLFFASRSISSLLSIFLVIIVNTNSNLFKNKDRVANSYFYFWIFFVLLVQSINILNSSSLFNLDLPFLLSTFFLISFSFILSKYPILINYSLFSFVFSTSVLSIFQFLGIGIDSIPFVDLVTFANYSRESVLGFHPNELSIYYSSSILLIIFYFLNKYKFEKMISKNKVIINILNISIFFFLYLTCNGLYKTGSRTGLIIFILGLFFLVFFKNFFVNHSKIFTNRYLFLSLFLVLIIFLFGSLLNFEEFITMFRLNLADSFSIRRTLLFDVTRNIANINLFFGYGEEGLISDTIDVFGYYVSSHNGFLDVFSYSGLVGLISFLSFLISLLIKVFKIALFEKDILFPLIYFIVLGELTLSTLFQAKMFFFFTAILIAVVSSRRKRLMKKLFLINNE